MKFLFTQKWRLTLKVIPFIAVIVLSKFLAHYFGLEFLSLSPLFTALISANVFLIGFLITGVLSDYKESEKLPTEMVASLEIITDECQIIYMNKKSKTSKECIVFIQDLTNSLINWFHKKEKTVSLLDKVSNLNSYFLAFEALTQANFITRLKQEQSNIRKLILRIHTIRETSFNEAGYAIAEVITGILITAMLFIKIDPYYESIFFVSFASFILIYMVLLIKDLDNPFGYYQKEALAEEVSLQPLYSLKERLENKLKLLK